MSSAGSAENADMGGTLHVERDGKPSFSGGCSNKVGNRDRFGKTLPRDHLASQKMLRSEKTWQAQLRCSEKEHMEGWLNDKNHEGNNAWMKMKRMYEWVSE